MRIKALDVPNEVAPPVKLVPKHEIAADALTTRQKAIVNAVKHAWKGYKEYAWGHDHLKPISLSYNDWFHLGLTMVDSLDTLYLMNLTEGTTLA